MARGAKAGGATDPVADRLIEAALAAAAEGAWRGVSVANLAARAGVDPEEAASAFAHRQDVLDAFARRADRRMHDAVDTEDFAGAPPRERLLETLMSRFDALAPHRAALRTLAHEAQRCPDAGARTLRRVRTSMGNALDAAGLAGTELERQVGAAALTCVWVRTCRTWLLGEQEDGADAVMAALDKDLGRLEALAQGLRGFASRRDG